MTIRYIKGDATLPQEQGPKVIVHCVNNIRAWGRGFVLSLRKSWPKSEEAYRAWGSNKEDALVEETGDLKLGEVQFVLVGPKLWVANLVGQNGVGIGDDGRPPIRYNAIREGLVKVNRFCKIHGATAHMPRMGSGLAGGNWTAIEQTVKAELVNKGVPVTVYDLPLRHASKPAPAHRSSLYHAAFANLRFRAPTETTLSSSRHIQLFSGATSSSST